MDIKRIFITSASGKIGRALLPELATKGCHIRALELEELVECKDKNIEIMQGDLRDPLLAQNVLKGMDAVMIPATVCVVWLRL